MGERMDKLTAAAEELNRKSDELSKVVESVNEHLKKLNIGIVVWLPVADSSKPKWNAQTGLWIPNGSIRSFDYGRVNKQWGLAMQLETYVDGQRTVEQWLFNEAPRFMRLEALKYLPALIDLINIRAIEMTDKLEAATVKVNKVLEGMTHGNQVSDK